MKKISLIEVFIGIVVVALLAAVLSPSLTLWLVRAREAEFAVNYSAVQKAAEDFAIQNYGRFPRNIDKDKTPSGQTLRDIVSAYDSISNPFTKNGVTVVINGIAWKIGQVGYLPNFQDSIPVGCTITAVGIIGDTVIVCPK
ncbi:MAG: hypothetical protein ABIH38_01230 [Patescibacteria group bacterium]